MKTIDISDKGQYWLDQNNLLHLVTALDGFGKTGNDEALILVSPTQYFRVCEMIGYDLNTRILSWLGGYCAKISIKQGIPFELPPTPMVKKQSPWWRFL